MGGRMMESQAKNLHSPAKNEVFMNKAAYTVKH
ncbi:MAG: hypothetical protein JWQ57_2999 [Mucilaginibacter sp.]|nr:hypothetical protein [Mucilaginibacter sp.]